MIVRLFVEINVDDVEAVNLAMSFYKPSTSSYGFATHEYFRRFSEQTLGNVKGVIEARAVYIPPMLKGRKVGEP